MDFLVVSCVGTKTLDGPRLRDFPATPLADRWNAWAEAIANGMSREPTLPALEVYDGPLWGTYLAALDELRKLNNQCQLFVVSAGLGLIAGRTRIPGYGATFAHDQPDSVSQRTGKAAIEEHRDWWRRLTTAGLVDSPRTLPDLVNSLDPKDHLILVLGSEYYAALYDDLRRIDTVGQMVLVGLKRIGNHLQPEVPSNLFGAAIPYTDFRTLRANLGCSMLQVHAATAVQIIHHYRMTGEWDPRLEGMAPASADIVSAKRL